MEGNQQPKSMMNEIFGSAEGFLRQDVTKTWGDAGYTTSSVEKWTWQKELKDIARKDIQTSLYTIVLSAIDPVSGWAFPVLNALGVFGGSVFRSSRYFYNYIQQVAPINNGFLTDPVQTYAMSASLQKQDIAQAVQQSLKTGLGYNLKKYYQYHKRRYKNRGWKYRAYKTTNFKPSSITFDKIRFVDSLPDNRNYRIIETTTDWTTDGQLYQDWLKREFGIYSFGSYAEPVDESNKPTERSVGVTVWSGSSEPSKTYSFPVEQVISIEEYELTKNMKVGETQEFIIFRAFENPYDKADESEVQDDPDNINLNTELDVIPYEFIVTVKVTIKSEQTITVTNPLTNKTTEHLERTYELKEIQRMYHYDSEDFYYLTELGNSNYPDFKDYWFIEEEDYKLDEEIDSTKTDMELFKFLAPIPIKDWFKGKDTWTQTIPKFQETELVKLQKELSKIVKENKDNEDEVEKEQITPDSVKGIKTSNKQKKRNRTETRNVSRKITRELNRSRRYEYNRDKLWDIKDYDERRIKRHFEYMSNLLGIDYLNYVTGLMSTDNWNGGYTQVNTYQSSIYLGAVFSNQSTESMEYWYEWAKRQYKLSGKEDSFNRWNSIVQSASSLQQLPQQVVKYETTDGTHWGGYSFCFIKKIKIKGRLRKIKRKHRYKDILRGRPMTIETIEQLRNVVEPLNELSSDSYYYNEHSGKEYPIGGGYFTGSGYTESIEPDIKQVFQNYHYTLFAKQSGSDEITCYAVCGLQFHTKLNDKNVWCSAWFDLELEYSRLRQKYIEKKSGTDIQAEIRIENGKKRRHIVHGYNMGIVPLEYDIIIRMNATSLERFVQRCTLNYSWLFQEQKGKRSSMKYYAPIIQIVAFIVSVVMTMYGQAWSWALFAKALAISVAVSIGVKLAINHLLLPLFKMLGLKGIIAYIILIIILIVAYMYGADGSQAAAPVMGNLTGQAAQKAGTQAIQQSLVQATQQAVQQSTVQGFQSVLKEAGTQIFNQLVGSNMAQVFSNSISYISQLEGSYQQDEMEKLQAEMNSELEASKNAFEELEAKQEELLSSMGDFSREAVLGEFTKNVIKFQDFGLQYEKGLDSIGAEGTLEYLWSFLDMRISNDIEYADPVNVTQFKVG